MLVLLIAGLVLMLGSCGPPDAPVVSSGLAHGGARYTIGSSPVVTLGGIDAPADQEFVRISSVRLLPDERIAIADAGGAGILVFDLSGRRRASMGRRGDGPGEFNTLTSMAASADTLIAFDNGRNRITWFSAAGEFIRDRTLVMPVMMSPRFLGTIDGLPVFASLGVLSALPTRTPPPLLPEGQRRDSLLVIRFDSTGLRFDTLSQRPGTERYLLRLPDGTGTAFAFFGFETRGFAEVDGRRLITGSSDTAMLRVQGQHAATAIAWPATPVPFTAAYLQAVRQHEVESAPADEVEVMRELLERSRKPSILPYYDRVLIGSDGTVWVRAVSAPGTPVRQWSVFSIDGSREAMVSVPDSLNVVAASRRVLVARHTGEYDVETVAVYDLHPVDTAQ